MKWLWHAALAAGLMAVAFNCAAADFAFESIHGKQVRLSDYRGKWVLVNFWATWCPPCREEMPDLVKLYRAHKDRDLVVIGIAMEDSPGKVARYVRNHHIPYPIVLGDTRLAEEQIGTVEALPTSYLYDPTGRLRSYQQGTITRESVETYIKSRSSGS